VTVKTIGLALAALAGFAGAAAAQPLLYAQRLPAGTVYMRLVNALPGAISIGTDFAGKVELGADGAARVSPYFVSTTDGGKTVELQVSEGGKTATADYQPKSGSFVTIVLHRAGDKVTAALIADKPEYNQLRARLAFYNATADCPAGVLTEASGPTIFSNLAPDAVAARGINPVAAKVVAGCAAGKAPTLDLGKLEAGGLYTVWMMRPEGTLQSFVAHDLIAPPRS
jgi:hypothetical protein